MKDDAVKEEIREAWEGFSDPYERLSIIAKYLTRQNLDCSIYDLFDFIRVNILNGNPYFEQSAFIQDIDWSIEV